MPSTREPSPTTAGAVAGTGLGTTGRTGRPARREPAARRHGCNGKDRWKQTWHASAADSPVKPDQRRRRRRLAPFAQLLNCKAPCVDDLPDSDTILLPDSGAAIITICARLCPILLSLPLCSIPARHVAFFFSFRSRPWLCTETVLRSVLVPDGRHMPRPRPWSPPCHAPTFPPVPFGYKNRFGRLPTVCLPWPCLCGAPPFLSSAFPSLPLSRDSLSSTHSHKKNATPQCPSKSLKRNTCTPSCHQEPVF